MTGSAASASPDPKPGERVLVCGVNWIGDTIMSMPAIQAYRRRHPRVHLALLVKPPLAPLWRLHRAPDEILTFEESPAGTFRAASMVRQWNFQHALILPNSIRSALIPFLAGVPRRRAARGGLRAWMVNDAAGKDGAGHQALECYRLLMPDAVPAEPEAPALAVPENAMRRAGELLAGLPRPVVGLLPGAARGPSKRWPAAYFAEAGRRVAAATGGGVAVLGAPAEEKLCAEVAEAAGPGARSLAGRCSLAEWAAALKSCGVVIANDSGGMHVAAAVGAPVVAIFGVTDPRVTGPLGGASRVLQAGAPGGRDIARASAEASASLSAIAPQQAFTSAMELLGGTGNR